MRDSLWKGIPDEVITPLMNKTGLINILLTIPIEDIEPKGIPYVRQHFDEGVHRAKFDIFWKYFVKTWMLSYDPNDWNVHGIVTDESSTSRLINRTNNPLERFNRKLNEAFPTAHPSVVLYVSTMWKLSQEYVELRNKILRGHASRPKHLPFQQFTLPEDYAAFEMDRSAVQRSKFAQLNQYKFLIGKSHYDPEDGCMYEVARVGFYEGSIVGYREQCKLQNGYVVDVPTDDCISIEEIVKYTGCGKESTVTAEDCAFTEEIETGCIAAGRAQTGAKRRNRAGGAGPGVV